MPTVAIRSEERIDVRGLLDGFEEAIEHLRVSYEKYFVGVDRVAPVKERDKVLRMQRELEKLHVRSTALRFRLGGLKARLVTYKHYWTRVERELERGVSRRDLMRMRRGLGAAAAPDTSAADEQAPNPNGSSGSSHAPAKPPPKQSTDPREAGLDPGHLRDVYKELVRAKKAAGESIDGLTYAALCRKLSREAPKLRQKHKCDDVRFEVATIGGKVRLKARAGG